MFFSIVVVYFSCGLIILAHMMIKGNFTKIWEQYDKVWQDKKSLYIQFTNLFRIFFAYITIVAFYPRLFISFEIKK